MMKFIGIIPARYASTRFPGKPLADMNGKPMIQRVYEQVKDVLDSVCVATDDIRIENAVKGTFDHVCLVCRAADGQIQGFVSLLRGLSENRRRV